MKGPDPPPTGQVGRRPADRWTVSQVRARQTPAIGLGVARGLRTGLHRISGRVRVCLLGITLIAGLVPLGGKAVGATDAFAEQTAVVARPVVLQGTSPVTGTVPIAPLSSLKLISYYPSQAAWTNMWTRWDPTQIDADFARIAALHANAVRIIIPPTVFGYPTPAPVMQAHLAQAVSLAASHGLRVQLTLFDWWNAYGDLAGSDAWSAAVLAPYHDDRRIAFVELQNEINTAGPAGLVWARHELPVVKAEAGTVPVTVSVFGLGALRTLKTGLAATPPDFYDLHYYDGPGPALATFRAAAAIVAPAPLFIGETGYSTTQGPVSGTAGAEAAQAAYLRAVEWAARAAGLPLAGVWTLNDFAPAAMPSAVADPGKQGGFGLYRTDGTPKPAAAAVAALFGAGTIDTSMNGGFEEGSGIDPSAWQRFRPDEGQFLWDHSVAHSGQSSVQLSATTGDSAGTAGWFTTPITTISSPGGSFTATAWAKGAAATGFNRVAIAWFSASNTYLGQAESPGLPAGTTGWSQLGVTARAPAGAAYAEVHLKSSHNRGAVWFDDVTFALT